MIVWSVLLWSLWSISSKRTCWTQTGEAIRHTHFQKRKKAPPRNENFKTLAFLFLKPSILWSGFHLHLILPLRNQRGMKSIFLISGLPSVTIRLNATVPEAFTHILSTAQLFLSSLFFHCRRSLRMGGKKPLVTFLHWNLYCFYVLTTWTC